MHRSQIFLWLLLSFIGGTFLASFVIFSQNEILAGMILCTFLIVIFFRRDSKIKNPKVALAAFLGLAVILGVARFNIDYYGSGTLKNFAEASAKINDPSGKHKLEVDLVGYIADEPSTSGRSQSLILAARRLMAGKTFAVCENVLIITKPFPEYALGDQVSIKGELVLPENSADSDFDYAAYLAKDGIFTEMKFPEIKNAEIKLSLLEKTRNKLLGTIFYVKGEFESSINRSLAEPNASFINGILLGSRAKIPDDLKNDFARTSTSHILAISGYNIAMVGNIIASFFLFFFRRKTAFWFSIAGIAIFTILTGAQASVVRAAIMGCLLLLAYREGRLYAARNAVILAGAVMIFINPRILRYDAGFQLSFVATLGLIYLSPFMTEKFKRLPDFFKFRENAALTVSAQIAVLPLILFSFKNLSLVSLPVNILMLPFVPAAMLLGLLTGIGGMATSILGNLLGAFAWLLTSYQIGLVRLFAKPSWSALNIEFPWYAMALAYALLVWAYIKYVRPESKNT